MIRKLRVIISVLNRFVFFLPLYLVKVKLVAFIRHENKRLFNLVFVVAGKDFEVLRFNLNLMRTNGMLFSTSNIVLFVPAQDFTYAKNLFSDCLVEKEEILGVDKSAFKHSLHVSPGWLYQQSLKLSLDRYFEIDKDLLILDGDTCIDLSLFSWGSDYIFRYSYENYLGYKTTCMDLGYPLQHKSYISHHSFFNTSVLKEIRKRLESFSGGSFEQGIVALANKNNGFFSEYELIYCEMKRNYSVKSEPFFLDNWGLMGFWAIKLGLLNAISRHSYR